MDVDRSLAFYEGVLGLRRLEPAGSGVRLGAQGSERALVELVERPGTSPSPGRGRTGLFHFALLLPDRPSLGRFARHVRDLGVPMGAADHLVSEALYLHDPDRLGIEVYADRPREAWRQRGRELVMTTEPLDWDGPMEAAGEASWEGLPDGTTIGHVHLHVGDLATARAFYGEGLGLDTTVWTYPGALFFSAGGYHHHLGTNVWAGAGATRPGEDEARLLGWTVELPDAESIAGAAASLEAAGAALERQSETEVATRDPWGTPFRLVAA